MRTENGADEIGELLGREILAFNRRRKAAVTIDDGRLQRVRNQPFLRPILNPERVADALDLRWVAFRSNGIAIASMNPGNASCEMVTVAPG